MIWSNYLNFLKGAIGIQGDYSKTKQIKTAILASNLYSAEFLLRCRETIILDSPCCIYNNILYPKTGTDLPCFGMDLMCFGDKKVVIVFDFQHPVENYSYDDKIVENLMGEYADNTKETIKFFEPGNHFSKYIFVRKCTADQVNDYLPDFKKYVTTYKALLDTYKPTGSDYSAYNDFNRYMRKLDPVEGYLAHKFDKEFAKQYVEEFLFPLY